MHLTSRKNLIHILTSILALAVSLPAASTPNGFTINRGISISHWLSQVPTTRPFPHHSIMYTELDAAFLVSVGYDHIRLPIDEEVLWNEDGKPIEANWARLQRGIEESLRHGLNVIVDLHIVRSHHFNAIHDGGHNTLFEDPDSQARFLELWRQLSIRLRHFPNHSVAYEILNEAMADDPSDWNALLEAGHKVIRKDEPERTIVMGSNHWQETHTFPKLEVPKSDPNIILSFHTYEPVLITHYGASWTPTGKYDGPIQYPGVCVDEAYAKDHYSPELVEEIRNRQGFEEHNRTTLARSIDIAVKRAEELGLDLYCGEFGCLPGVGRQQFLQYYRDNVSVFIESGIAYANWSYRGAFRIIDPVTLEVDHELIEILTGKTSTIPR